MPDVAKHRLDRAYPLAVQPPSTLGVNGAFHELALVQWIGCIFLEPGDLAPARIVRALQT